LFSKWQTLAQNPRLLLSGPFRCERKQRFNLVEHQFSIHIRKPKQEPGLADRDSCSNRGFWLSSAAIHGDAKSDNELGVLIVSRRHQLDRIRLCPGPDLLRKN
jgi:hypothetical protein